MVVEVDFSRERRWWDEKAPKEENDIGDECINRALRWREIERHLPGMRTILEVGGGSGAFSIPLARRGFTVTHLDISPAMLEIARRKAEGVNTIRFVEGNAVDLSAFSDASFDLVLNMDGAVSFCGSRAGDAIRESCRVAGQGVILAVSNRALLSAEWARSALQVLGSFSPAVENMLRQGFWHQEQFPENSRLTRGMTQDYLGTVQAYTPADLRSILEGLGMTVLRCSGLGSLALLCGAELVSKVQEDDALFEKFVDYCEYFDTVVMSDGPGTRQRAGVLAVAVRRR